MSQAGGTVAGRNVGSVKAFWRLILGVTEERDNRKGSHLHVPPSVTQANTPSRQVSMSFLPHTPFAASFYHKAFSLQDFLHPHLFSASSNSSLKLCISIPSHPQHPIFHPPTHALLPPQHPIQYPISSEVPPLQHQFPPKPMIPNLHPCNILHLRHCPAFISLPTSPFPACFLCSPLSPPLTPHPSKIL